MNAVVFCGPTLRNSDRQQFPNINFLPPVQQGHLYRVARDRPPAIGIIDGYFDGVPAVWHKEILWALTAGIPVFGSSSMGALRAAELYSFGMIGIGQIFEDFRDGRLTDDDEVALVHGPAELGYPSLSEPMVNIRATVEQARLEGIFDEGTAELIISVAKALFYQRRTWPLVIRAAEEASGADLRGFYIWLGKNNVDQKRSDALLMLTAMDEFMSSGRSAPAQGFVFEWTEAWASAPWLSDSSEAGEELSDEEGAILDELRLQDGSYSRIRREALLRMLAQAYAEGAELPPSSQEIRSAIEAFRLEEGILQQADLVRWSQANCITGAEFQRLIAGEATLDKLAIVLDRKLRRGMLDHLRLQNSFTELRRRALRKRAIDFSHAYPHSRRPSANMLVEWYFCNHLRKDIPSDLNKYIQSIGINKFNDFYSLIRNEYFFFSSKKKIIN
jgi:hypothetical protein